MAKVEIIAKLKQKNDADFKIADAKDIEMEDGSDLQSTIDDIKKNGTNIDTEKYATKEELETKADREHTHDYNDITNAPEIPSIEGLATEDYVDTAIANAQLSGGEIDTSNFATKEDLNAKVDKKLGYSLVSDSEINRLSSIDNYDDTEIKNELNNKSDLGHTHSYKELSDKPTIPSIEGLATENYVKNEIANAQLSSGEVDLSGYATKEELSVKADKIHTHTIADVDNLQTTLNNKSDLGHTHSYNDITNTPEIPSIEGLATKEELNNKVDKLEGHSLISDSEIIRLSKVDNYDDTELRNKLNNKSDKGHRHDYSEITNPPVIPSIEGLATEDYVKNEIANAQLSQGEVDLSGYATKNDLDTKVDKINGYSLVSDIEITRLSGLDNYDDSSIRNDLNNKANISHTHNINEITKLQNILDEIKNGQNIDLTNYATKDELNNKVDKKKGYSLIADNEITRLSKLTNYDDTTIKNSLNNKVDKVDGYSLIADSEITRLSGLDNYDDTELRNKLNNKSDKGHRHDYSEISNTPTIPSIEGLATEIYVDTKIAEAQLSGGEIDLSGYVTKDELNNKADKTELHEHSNKNILDGITQDKISSWDNKSNFSGKYEDLENPPTIPTVDVNKNYVDTQLNKKVDKKNGYSLISDTEIQRLANVDNYDDSDIKNTLKSKADKTELHSHNNKEVLDSITRAKINSWDNKSDFSGDYNDLSNPPTIPIVDSALSSTSTNAIQNKVVKSALDGKANSSHNHSYKDLSDKPTIPTVDSSLSTTSTNAIQNKVVANALNGKANSSHTHNISDITNLQTTLDNKSDIGHIHSYKDLSDKPIIDSALSSTSTNAIQNKVVKNALDGKANSSHNHSISNITNLQTTLDGKSNINHTHSYKDLSDKPTIPSIEGLATENYVKNEIANAQLSGEEVDLSGYATKDELNTKVDKIEGYSLVSDSEIERLAGVDNYDDTAIKASINNKANSLHTHSISNITNLQTSLDGKSNVGHTHSYKDLSDKPTIDSALSSTSTNAIQNKVVTNALNNKANSSDVYTKTQTDNLLSTKANKSDLHSHNNKTVLDSVTSDKVEEWNNKSTFSGDYKDLDNKPTIPVVDSVLSSTSTNAIQNKVVKSALDKKSNTGHKHSYSELTDTPTIPTMPTIDSALSSTSTNPIQNKVVKSALDGKSNVGHTHSYNDLSDTPIIPTVTNDLTNALKSNYDTAYIHSQSAHAPSNAEKNVQSDWNVTDTTSDAFIKNKPSIHNHNNKNVLDGITVDKVNEWNNKSDFSGDYNDLSNPPTIPIVDSTLSTTSINAIQNKVVTNALNNKANSSHNHTIDNIANLQSTLNNKSDKGHRHDYSELENAPTIDTALSTTSTNSVQNKVITTALNKKANTSHTHNYSELTNPPTIPTKTSQITNDSGFITSTQLNTELNKKANTSHNHAIADITNLQNTLDGKASSGHRHSYNDLLDTPTIPTVDSTLSTTSTNAIQNKVVTSALNKKANSSHTHSINDITNLQNSLNSKSDKGHKHDYSELENPPTIPTVDSALSTTSTNAIQNKVVTNALNNKANSSHTHNYAGSPSSGGSASSAIKLATSRKISLNGDASGSANFDGTSDITINTSVRKYCMVGSDVENSNGWYKVASETMSGYGDTNITFVVTSTYGNYHSGILQLQIRSDNTNISCKTLVWFNRYGFSTDNFIVNINNMTWTLYANQTIRYSRLMFEVISESSIKTKTTGITLFNSSTKESTTPVATVKSKDGGKVDNALTANKLATSRTLTIGKTGKTFDGSANVSWSLDEIGASASSHTHTINNVTNLQTALDGKSNTGHTHDYSELNNPPTIPVVDSALSSTSTNAIQNKVVTNALNNKANKSHTHSYKDLSDKPTIPTMPTIDSALSSTSTNPVQNKVVKTALDGKANSSHTHSISNITNLQTTLDGKSNTGHTHDYTKLNNLPTIPTVTNDLTNELKANYDTAYTHSQSAHAPSNAEKNVQSDWNVTNTTSDAYIKNKPTIPKVDSSLSTTSTNAIQNKVVKSALDGKANSSHSHNISDVSNLQTTLDNKSNTNHTHNYAGSSSAGGDATNALACSGNAKTSTKLQTARTINGTSFDGSANITTSKWGTARNITIGNTTKTIDGSGNVSWTLREIGIYDSVVKIVTNTQELKSALLQGGAIYVLGGTYPLAQNEVLEYVSNTHLIAIGDVTISVNPTSSTYIAMRPHLDGTEGGYTGVTNFNMSGITFDGNGATNACGLFATAHGRNIHIEGCTFKNINNSWHLVEINSSDTVVFDRCTISDYNYREIKEGDYFTEAFQLDYAGEGGLYPFTCLLDNTGCQNITFNNCTFTRVKTTWTACIGSHSYLKNSMPKNVTINGCSFDDIDNCIYGLDYKNLSVINCSFYNVATAIIIDSKEDNNGTSITAIGNRYNGKQRYKNISQFNGTEEGRFIMHHNYHNRLSSSNISNNFIEWAYSHGIGITPVDTTIIGNSVRYCGKHGIYLYGGQQTSIIGNTSVYNGQLEWYTGYDIYVIEGAIQRVWRCNISNNAAYVTVNTTSNFNDVIVANNLNTKG
ncbi:MAG: phage tail repeat domain-containing protein [Clostridium sp.]|nr:phage tail repeat domain-containing protein [Clostridium sp.]